MTALRLTISIILSCAILLSASLLLLPSYAGAQDKGSLKPGVNQKVRSIRPEKPVKIKFKRTADGKYTWELTGDDVEKIIKIDNKLKKHLKVK